MGPNGHSVATALFDFIGLLGDIHLLKAIKGFGGYKITKLLEVLE